jgi:hypothetical protein
MHQVNSLKDTFKSVAAAFFGVQSNKSRKQDFSQGKLSHFILVGIVCLLLFISLLILIVHIIINLAV